MGNKPVTKEIEITREVDKMAQSPTLTEPVVLKCRYCNQAMPPSFYRRQAESWLKSHEDNCKDKPSDQDNGKP